MQGNPPIYEEHSLWEALSVVSQTWSFPTALFGSFGLNFPSPEKLAMTQGLLSGWLLSGSMLISSAESAPLFAFLLFWGPFGFPLPWQKIYVFF